MDKRTDRTRALALQSRFQAGDLQVHPDRRVVVREGTDIPLEPREMEVLIALSEKAGEVVSTDELLIKVWQGDFYGDNPVNKTISILRKSIGDDPRAPRYIETLRGRGYRLIAPVSFPNDYRRMPKTSDTWTQGSPFVGLAAFDANHSSVFSGRSRMTAELLGSMRTQIDRESRFVLLVGASGCGKTSLLLAGALPLLTQPGGFGGLRALSVASCDLAAAHAGDVMTQLATALSTWALADRTVFPPQSVEDLKKMLIETPESIDGIIEKAFRRHPERGLDALPHAHLLLTIDHAEALVSADRDPATIAAFERALCAICDAPRTLVTMITRSDYYPKLAQALPILTERKTGGGHLDVLTPKYGEIAEIIRIPAWQAGLKFEIDENNRDRLDDTLRDATVGQPDALPLLQHTLQALYERRTDDGTLTYTAYRDIGGLEGAIAHRAEEVFATLPANVRSKLDIVLAKLIVIQSDSDAVSAQRSNIHILDGEACILVEAFIRGRLFVSELHDGRPEFGVSHEALLRQWPRAVEWTQDNRRLLQARARLKRAAARWTEEGQSSDHLLNPGRQLGEALEVARLFPENLNGEMLQFLRSSEHLYRRKRLFRNSALVALVALTIMSMALALAALTARNQSEKRRKETLDLVGYMLVDVSEKLRPTGDIQALEDISRKTLIYLESEGDQNRSPEELVNYSRALRTRGEIFMQKGESDAALMSFSHALSASAMALSLSPSSLTSWSEIGQASYWLGFHHYKTKNFESAEREWNRYLLSSERTLKMQKENSKWKIEYSYALNSLGSIKKQQGDDASALDLFERSAALKQEVLESQPKNDDLQKELADTLSWIGSSQESMGLLREASKSYGIEEEILRGIVEKKDHANVYKRQLATSLLRNGTLAIAMGKISEAESSIEESIEIFNLLTKDEPANMVWKRDLAHCFMEAANIARMNGNRNLESTYLAKAIEITGTLQKKDRPLPEWLRINALLVIRHEANAMPNSSLKRTDAAIDQLEMLHTSAPTDKRGLSALATGLIMRGEIHASAGDAASARNDWDRAIKVLGLSAPRSKDHNILKPWVVAHIMIGQHERMKDTIHWLAANGFADPDFVKLTMPSTR